ncbi:MAG: hypothetical protein WKF34_07370 [Pyrinomonadaceae bacterium]
MGALGHLYYGSSGSAILVPDVNAFLHNTNIKGWEFVGITRFTIGHPRFNLILWVNHQVRY